MHAREAIEVYAAELPEYRTRAGQPGGRAELIEFAVWQRRRVTELARDEAPMDRADLAVLNDMAQRRAAQGVGPAAARQAATLHASMLIGEVRALAETDDLEAMLAFMSWLGGRGAFGTDVYLRAHAKRVAGVVPLAERVESLTAMLLAGEPDVEEYARTLGLRCASDYLVLVVRAPRRDEIIEPLFRRHRVALGWSSPTELVALLPAADALTIPEEGTERALRIGQDCADALGPCALGFAAGPIPLALEWARQVAEAVPATRTPATLLGMADVFVELGAAAMPPVARWLRQVEDRLAGGPDLLRTLDAFYRHDMHRGQTAATLHVHPRTVDYRLTRVRELTGLDPGSVRGVRVFSTVVRRLGDQACRP